MSNRGGNSRAKRRNDENDPNSSAIDEPNSEIIDADVDGKDLLLDDQTDDIYQEMELASDNLGDDLGEEDPDEPMATPDYREGRRNDDLMLFSSSFPVNSTNPNAIQNASTLSSIPDVYEPGTNDDPNAAHNLTELDTLGLPLNEIVIQDAFRQRIAENCMRLLTTFTDEHGHSVYHGRIRAMCAANRESLEVSYMHLVESNAFLAKLVANVPTDTLAIFDAAAMKIVLRLFENYKQIRPEVHVRITDYPAYDAIRDLRFNHLNTLVRTSGVVTRRSGVFPQLQAVKYDCQKCGAILGPFVQEAGVSEEIKVQGCPHCESRGPFTVNTSQTIYRNYQRVTLQEAPGSVPAGRLPRHKEVILLSDLIDSVRPGELVEVTGVYRNNYSHSLSARSSFPVFATVIEAIHVSRAGDDDMMTSALRLTEDDEKEIRALAEDPLIGQRIISSIAPSIYGHRDIKIALALALFGGQSKNVQGKHPIRGDINVLLLGDPGTAKSQFLKYIEKTASRAVFTTGQGASAVGLTASVRKDPVTREWTLEGGALVLADRGVCCIDEFDKMNEQDRTSIHEAMEQQSISISKAGIVTTLQARCAIIAAANPVRGRYNSAIPFSQNVNLSEPILSRFDILCVVRDIVDPVGDESLARFVVGSHLRSTLGTTEGPTEPSGEALDQALLKKYILYARSRIRPELSQMDVDKIARVYADVRKESMQTGALPITVRHLESMVRMAEAHARLHLRAHVRSDDIDLAIRVMLDSFISAQKHSVMGHLKRAFSKYIAYKRDTDELLFYLLGELVRSELKYLGSRQSDLPSTVKINLHDLQAKARTVNVHDLRPFLSSPLFSRNGYRLLGEEIVKDL